MAGWSKLADGFALDCLKTLQNIRKSDFCLDLEPGSKTSINGGEEDKLRCLFEQLLCIFLREICGSECFRLLPPMLGNGKSVDLFKLYLLVREKGGYERVSRNEFWDLVAVESGLGSGVGSALKLVYVKYLDALARWLQKNGRDKDSGTDLGCCLMESEPENLGSSSETSDHQKEDGECPHLDLESSEVDVRDIRKSCDGSEIQSSVESDENRKSGDDMKNVDDGGRNIVFNRKRKRDNSQRTLDWVTGVAKNPCDPVVGSLPERSKWKCYGMEQLWKQVLAAREAIFLKRNVDKSTDQSVSNLMKQKMHPSMYDDHTGSERLRSSGRLSSSKDSRALPSKKSNARTSSESSSSTQSDLDNHVDRPSSADSVVGLFGDSYNRKRVPVGPLFQAKVPEWAGETHEIDSRWLGSRVWPLENKERNNHLIERDQIGKGRQDSCGCQHTGSVECVRFHVAEKRMRVKIELGLAFHRWKFDKMGEEVSLSWTKEEEKRFQAIVKANRPSQEKCFWDEMFTSFPSKRREELVSYYFNVYLLQRRGDQNRSNPSNIDSDDEESEFVLLSNRFGHGAARSPGSIFRSPKKPPLNPR